MATFLSSHPGDRPHQGDGQLEAMLSGQPLPENASTEMRGVNDLLASLRAAPTDRAEHRGQAPALDAFRTTFAGFNPSREPRRRPTMISKLLGARVGAVLVAGAVSFGAAGAAAYAGVLPSGLQRFAHDTISAPAPEPIDAADQDKTVVETDTPDVEKDKSADSVPQTGSDASKKAVGPDATGSAAFGLCTAWAHVQTSGQAAEKSVAFRNLVTAFGTPDKITAYCKKVVPPGVTKTDTSATHVTRKPAAHVTGKPSHPTVSSSSHPSGKPTG